MRTLVAFVLILALLVGAIAVYLVVTTPSEPAGVKFPLSAEQRALVTRVPDAADGFALIPTAGPLQKKLLANPVTRDPITQWTETQPIPGPWLLGDADVVVWRQGKQTSYAVRVDALRAFLVRTWMMWNGGVPARWDGTAFLINDRGGAALPEAEIDDLLQLAGGLPPGDLLAVQMNRARGAYPPMGRPAVSTVRVDPREIVVVSRARSHPRPGGLPAVRAPQFPKGAMLAVSFVEPPRMIADLERVTGIDVDTLVSGGGSIVLYDIDAGTLLPRPKGLVAVPADERRRAAMAKVTGIAELVGQTRDTGKELLASFDRRSMDLYLMDTFVPATWPSTSWAARIDPGKLVPVLEKLGDSTGLRLASGRLHRAARDLRRWISALEQAESIEAAASEANGTEELRVRIATK